MEEAARFFKDLNLSSDFEAQSYREWQLHQAKQKPFLLVKRLRKIKPHDKTKTKEYSS